MSYYTFCTSISAEKCNSLLIGPQECNYVETSIFAVLQMSTGTCNRHMIIVIIIIIIIIIIITSTHYYFYFPVDESKHEMCLP